nr:DNA adenine methylase [Paenibacillus bovis]
MNLFYELLEGERYLGNKSTLLDFIDDVIKKYDIQGDTFADLLAGTGVAGDYFKDRFKIISNDYMYFSKVINNGKCLSIQRIYTFLRMMKFGWQQAVMKNGV